MNTSNTTQNSSSTSQPATHQNAMVKNTIKEATIAANVLRRFMSPAELETIGNACRGEEKQFFIDKMVEMANIILTMPQTYETDGQGLDAVAHLHYFLNDMDWYISEKDMNTEQHQAFGLARIWEKEQGYISIQEITTNGAELDLYWTPKPLRDC